MGASVPFEGTGRSLVERLAVWALHRTTDAAVALATQMLEASSLRQLEAQWQHSVEGDVLERASGGGA